MVLKARLSLRRRRPPRLEKQTGKLPGVRKRRFWLKPEV